MDKNNALKLVDRIWDRCEEIEERPTDGYRMLPDIMELKEEIRSCSCSRWIPVSERLPVNSNLIMFYTKYDGMRMGRFNGDDWNTVCNVKFSKMAVTHWMPLPSVPQEVDL